MHPVPDTRVWKEPFCRRAAYAKTWRNSLGSSDGELLQEEELLWKNYVGVTATVHLQVKRKQTESNDLLGSKA